jgi:hypothetical protein
VTASAAPPPFDGLHWKPVAKVIETFRERWGVLATDKFNARPWWYRWSTASGWPRRLVHTVLPPETKIEIDSDALDPDRDDEIEIRLNGEACCGWLAVWDPPAAAVSKSPSKRAKRAQKHASGRDPQHDREGAAAHVDHEVAAHGPLRRVRTGKPGPKEYDVWPDLFRHLDSVVAVKKRKFTSFSEAAREAVNWLEQDRTRRPQLVPDTVRNKIRDRRPDLVEGNE